MKYPVNVWRHMQLSYFIPNHRKSNQRGRHIAQEGYSRLHRVKAQSPTSPEGALTFFGTCQTIIDIVNQIRKIEKKNSAIWERWKLLELKILLLAEFCLPSVWHGIRWYKCTVGKSLCYKHLKKSNAACFYTSIVLKLLIIVQMWKQHEEGN